MHELSVSRAVVDAVIRHAAGRPVIGVHLRVGALRQVIPESLAFYWDIVTRETLCAGSVLEQELIEARLRCTDCDREWTIDVPAFRCPGCGGAEVRIVCGDELEVESIEVEEAECIA
jgi:hydrogenase nickel incorporation protein HypA/HybF